MTYQLEEMTGRASKSVCLWQLSRNSDTNRLDFLSYVAFRHVGADGANSSAWSVPVRLPSAENSNCDLKLSVVVPSLATDPMLSNSTRAYVLTCHVKDAICYIIVKKNEHPSVLISNYCDFKLHLGQSSKDEVSGLFLALYCL